MKDRSSKAPGRPKQDSSSSVDSLLRSVYDSLALKVLAEAADNPASEGSAVIDEALDALESSLETALPNADKLEPKRARS